ncbi:hypothetical protein [Desulfovibrio sp.]|uniref:hypothetical protein n=1 Tax=Desulfovibrio sp. TaxID=885 RepID=UPI0025BADE32|nr:hypothetical protein [Desulfovibrio sp.]
MCVGGGGVSTPEVQQVAAPTVAATPPPAEPVAEAPVTNEGAKRSKSGETKRKGTSALRINLNLGGGNMGAAGGTSGLSIPQ